LRFDGFENKLNSKWIAQIVQFTTVFTNVWSSRHTCVLWCCLRNTAKNWFNADNPSENCISKWRCNLWVDVMLCMSAATEMTADDCDKRDWQFLK
jgi:hypothetical protein